MINLNNLNWQDILVLCLKKFEYEKAAALYSSLSPVQRIIAAITGRKPKDPCPDLSSDALAVRYQSAFNKAHRFNGVPFGVRTNINDNDTVHITLRYQAEDRLPVLTATYYEDGTAYVEKAKVLPGGATEKVPVSYPLSEIALPWIPDRDIPEVSELKRAFADALQELSLVVHASGLLHLKAA